VLLQSTGKATSAATVGGDPAATLTTKGYVDAATLALQTEVDAI